MHQLRQELSGIEFFQFVPLNDLVKHQQMDGLKKMVYGI